MGWQGKDPSTDFRCALPSLLIVNIIRLIHIHLTDCWASGRGGGFISLENLLYFAKRFPVRLYKKLYMFFFVTITWHVYQAMTFRFCHSNATCLFRVEILPGPSAEAGWGSFGVGIPVCRCWHQYYVHAYPDAWPWSRYMNITYCIDIPFWSCSYLHLVEVLCQLANIV